MIVSAIAAVAENGIIGRNGDLPWHLPDDLKYFQRITRGHHVITGRLNYESIPAKYRPLKDRVNIVVSRNPQYEAPGAIVVDSLGAGLELAHLEREPEAFIIGGGQIFREALTMRLVDRLYLTIVHADVDGDVRFPVVDPDEWEEVARERHERDERHAHAFSFVVLERRVRQAP
ncbi:MAG: dihydrofolate reductase [Flavobacteriales bacterium]|nr:dihydrofolate reductase [Flavobacteriales bacterium]HPF89708.1 dihydrofolate reductase [Flavobacteriales bacterium]